MGIAAPRIIPRFTYSCLARIVQNVPEHHQQVCVILNGFALVTVLQQVSAPVILSIETLGITHAQLFHNQWRVALRVADQQVNVVFYQAVSTDFDLCFPAKPAPARIETADNPQPPQT